MTAGDGQAVRPALKSPDMRYEMGIAAAFKAARWSCACGNEPGYCPVEAADNIRRAVMRTLRERDGEWVAVSELAEAASVRRDNVARALTTPVVEGKVQMKDDRGEDWYALASASKKPARPRGRSGAA